MCYTALICFAYGTIFSEDGNLPTHGPICLRQIKPNARKKILCKHKIIFPPLWPHRLSVRTSGFHPGKRSSTLLGVTNLNTLKELRKEFFLFDIVKP